MEWRGGLAAGPPCVQGEWPPWQGEQECIQTSSEGSWARGSAEKPLRLRGKEGLRGLHQLRHESRDRAAPVGLHRDRDGLGAHTGCRCPGKHS